MRTISPRRFLTALALAGTVLTALPVAAQETGESRMRKLESEVRALQREVFPGTDGRYFTPEVSTDAATAATPTGAPATTAVTDMLARLQSLELQLTQMTAQTEENTNALEQLSARMALIEGGAVPAAATPATVSPAPANAATIPASTPASIPARAAAPAPNPAPATGPTAERLAGVQAIVKPQTEDAGDDEYAYGFRLWEAKFYPEAQQQLKLFVEKYPDHVRTSFGRNLLGRAYLDDGQPREAATWFLQNYQNDKNGPRAPDSLLFLAETMIQLKDTRRACIALAEFGENYTALATGRLQGQYDAGKARVTCN